MYIIFIHMIQFKHLKIEQSIIIGIHFNYRDE